MEPWASYWDMNRSSTDMTMSANRSTAYRTATTAGTWGTAISNTFSGTGNVYVELTITAPVNNVHIGVVNASAPNTDYPGQTTNGLSWSNNGNVYYNGTALAPSPGFNANAGDTLAIAIYGSLELIQFRNITQNTAWSPLYSLAGVGKPPYLLATSLDTAGVGGSVYANFYGPFVSTPPAASPAFTAWNPEALFSEQPVKVIDFDALLTDGSYTSSNINDLENIPFSYVKWGDAVLDAQNNLVFTDWVIDDLPIFSIVIQVTGPANNWLWAAWDYGTPFVFDKVHIPTSASVAVANVQIPPPPPTTNPPNVGQGHVLQIFSSCDAASVFTWSQGRVHGTEDVLVWGPVETATRPPSIVGRSYTVTKGTVNANFPAFTPLVPPPLFGQGGGAPPTFPPPTPPPIGAIPHGILVGPAIAAAAVPPSVAGIARLIYAFGSATTPPASAAFPEFTVPVYNPPIVFSNIFTDGVSPTAPPHTTTTAVITLSSNMGPPIGPALPPVVPGGTRPFMAMAETSAEEDELESEAPEPENAPNEEEPEPEPSEPSHRSRRGRGRRK